jgi:hypothetical protein
LFTSGQNEESIKGVIVPRNIKEDSLNGNRYALIIGVSSYDDKRISTLSYAHTDALNFYDF